jgi:hypothetical protein
MFSISEPKYRKIKTACQGGILRNFADLREMQVLKREMRIWANFFCFFLLSSTGLGADF